MKKKFSSNVVNELIVEVIPLAGFNAQLAYRVPRIYLDKIRKGQLVLIPIRNKKEFGVVARMDSCQNLEPNRLKLILEIVLEQPVMNDNLFRLMDWCSMYYACNYESILEVMIPSFLRKGISPRTSVFIKLSEEYSNGIIDNISKKAPKQAEVLKFLSDTVSPIKRNYLIKHLSISASVINSLIKKGLISEVIKKNKRDAYNDTISSESSEVNSCIPKLTNDQIKVTKKLKESINENKFSVEVIHGVTGSGKTEVYLDAITSVVSRGGGAIFLVPEIALAPQTVSRVRNRLQLIGVKTVVWHSNLSDGERFDSWNSIVNGEASVVVGARSAVFAPVKNLELIIVDEEHEPSYKQSDSPRYHARDVAVYRSFINKTVCVLGSATPSLETYFNASNGKYKIHKMLNRIDNRQLPKLHIVDMRREFHKENYGGPISKLLSSKLIDRFKKREQSILFLNRRGFASNFLCNKCGHVINCIHCSIPMTVHRTDWTLRCHLCTEKYNVPKVCPSCGEKDIFAKGFGTQRIEDIVKKIIPKANIVRIDSDVMRKKNLYRSIFNDFRIGKIDILVGTQMIAKGLDFPNVTLVGLVDADRSLHVEDFRSAERTFQLIVQVSGRAGRGDRSGEVVVQSCTPSASPILSARQSDFDGFLIEMLSERKEFNYPPYRHLIRHMFLGKNPEKIIFFMKEWKKILENSLGSKLDIRGPSAAPIEKINDEYRFQLWYFTKNITTVIGSIEAMRRKFNRQFDKDLRDWVDVDPVQLS